MQVGSSLELSQRLDEPLEIDTRLSNLQLSQKESVPMHIFDIRRSNSVIELWRQFARDNGGIRSQQMTGNIATETAAINEHVYGEEPTSHGENVTSAPEAENQSLMAAFEAELASLLHSAENTEQRATQPEASSATEPASPDNSPQRPHHPLELAAATFLYHLVHGANSVQSELKSRLPELQDHLRHAQRTVPENVRSSLQSLLATIEAHMRTAFQNLPDNGRQLAEDAINAGRPVAEHAADGLRMMASELNEASRTLFAAFENEFGRFATGGQNTTSDGPQAAPSPFPATTAGGTVLDHSSQGTNTDPIDPVLHQKDGQETTAGMPSAESPKANMYTLPPDLESPGWDHLREGQNYDYNPPAPGHHQPFLGPPPDLPAPPIPPRHWSPIPPPHPPSYPPYHSPWQMPWDPIYPIQHFPPAPPFPSPHGAEFYPSQAWRPSNIWFNALDNHNPDCAPPAPPPKEASGDFDRPTDIPDSKVLFVGNVGFNVNERMIQDVFASKGFLGSVRLAHDSDTGKHAGFGYIHFPSSHSAMAAMDALQGVHIDGHAINLEFSDDPLIDSVQPPETPAYAEPRTLYETFAGQDRPDSWDARVPSRDESGSGSPAVQSARARRDGRRKSVTFQEPENSPPDLSDEEAVAGDIPRRFQSPPLIDLTADDDATYHQSNEIQDQLPEMSRFPPVSQLEAQLFANPQQSRASEITARPAANQSTRSLGLGRSKSWDEAIPYEPNPLYNANREESSTSRDGSFQTTMGLSGPGLRRSNTVACAPRGEEPSDVPPATLWGRFPDNSPLRRRASERHSLRRDTRDSGESDTWARLDRRERRRSRYSSHQTIPGSFPLEEPQPVSFDPLDASVETQETEIDRCVSSLVDMGYGTAGDGGQARMAVYAAASNGNLYDAIDMIEEERKAYARQGRE